MLKSVCPHQVSSVGRTGYITYTAQCTMEIQDSCFKNYKEFQDGDSRALNQERALLSTGPCVATQFAHPAEGSPEFGIVPSLGWEACVR